MFTKIALLFCLGSSVAYGQNLDSDVASIDDVLAKKWAIGIGFGLSRTNDAMASQLHSPSLWENQSGNDKIAEFRLYYEGKLLDFKDLMTKDGEKGIWVFPTTLGIAVNTTLLDADIRQYYRIGVTAIKLTDKNTYENPGTYVGGAFTMGTEIFHVNRNEFRQKYPISFFIESSINYGFERPVVNAQRVDLFNRVEFVTGARTYLDWS